jgi:hypothetical protein
MAVTVWEVEVSTRKSTTKVLVTTSLWDLIESLKFTYALTDEQCQKLRSAKYVKGTRGQLFKFIGLMSD